VRKRLLNCVGGYANRRFTDSFTDSGHSARRNSLMHTHQNLEARVGIEHARSPQTTENQSFISLLMTGGHEHQAKWEIPVKLRSELKMPLIPSKQ
jgi:hypothetical protein